MLLVGSAAVLGAEHFDTLREGWQDRLFSLQGIVMLTLLYPLVKALHELAHGWAVKRWGGEVHEMGVMLLVFLPVPYVDASASTRFESPAQRMMVAAAGVLTELGIAALAMWFWVYAEPGLARALAWQTMLIGTVSSLLVNGNPLLKFDAYYVLADALQIPNLAKRANAHIGWLARRYLLGDREAEPAVQAPGEAPWLTAYAVLSFVYRTLLVAGILLFVSGRFFAVGIVLAAWALAGSLLIPLIGRFWRLTRTLSLRRRRLRGYGLMLGGLMLAWAAVAWLPLPHNLLVQGVVWVPENARLRVAEARLAGSRARLEAATGDRVERELAQQALAFARGEAERLRERVAALLLRAHREGELALPRAADLPGRLLARGEAVGWLLAPGERVVRAFLDQAAWDQLQQAGYEVTARRASRLAQELPARVVRLIPGATRELPSRVLGVSGGGPWPEVPQQPTNESPEPPLPQALRPGFIMDLRLPGSRLEWPEERIYLRFALPTEPLLPRLQALTALHRLRPDRDYLVQDDKVQIIDPHTGRVLPDRQWSQGLQQLVEIKEGLEPSRANRTLAKISYQRFFRRYHHLCGLSGTAREVATELWRVYGLAVARVPTHRPVQRRRLPPRVFARSEARWDAVVARLEEWHAQDKAVLVGCDSVAASETLSRRLAERGLPHRVLNARQSREEAELVARAGQPGSITVTTQMAGRGTDIRIAGSVRENGGLHVLLSACQGARRIDRQLEGRCARQGDPGTVQYLLSWEDALVRQWRPRWLALRPGGRPGGRPGLLLMRWLQWRAERAAARQRDWVQRQDEQEEELMAYAGASE